MPSFHCITYGCQMNVNDSAWVARSLVGMGWQESAMEEADFVFMNTCSVREKPQHKVLSMLGIIRDVNPKASVAVAGCVAQQMGEKLWEKNAHVRLVVGSDHIAAVPKAFARLEKNPRLRLSYLKFTEEFPDRNSGLMDFKQVEILPTGAPDTHLKSNDTRAFINIMQGCDNFCAYCIVPYTRGPRKSRATSSIIEECQDWLARGTKDLTLLGQNVNVFGQDSGGDGTSFVDLLYKIADLDGVRRLHMVTPHPRDFLDGTVQAYKDLSVLSPRLHLPLQAGSDNVLKSMGRGYTNTQFLRIVEKLKNARPDIALSTDLIVGFPGETEEDFKETLRMVKEVGFIASFSFIYSDRPGTRASKMSDKIPQAVQLERLNRLIALQNELGEAWLKSLENVETEVLLEAPSKKPKYTEITDSPSQLSAEEIKQRLQAEEMALQNNDLADELDAPKGHGAGSHADCADRESSEAKGAVLNQELSPTQSWQGHDVWGNTVNVLIPTDQNHKAGDIVPVRIQLAKKHSLLANIL